MADRTGFQQKLAGIMKLAKERGMRLTAGETRAFFAEDHLSGEQMDLVFDYLLSQKVAVQGYVRQPGVIREAEKGTAQQAPRQQDELDEEERTYLDGYLAQIRQMRTETPEEERFARCLQLVADEAVRMHRAEVFLGDLIQEGNAALAEVMAGSREGEDRAVEAARGAMQALLTSQIEMKRRDRQMVEQVSRLDETIRQMTDELGRKVDVEEVAGRMGLTEDEIRDILKLAGEEPEDGQ